MKQEKPGVKRKGLYADFAEKADAWEGKDLNNEELIYYTETLNRISVKLHLFAHRGKNQYTLGGGTCGSPFLFAK